MHFHACNATLYTGLSILFHAHPGSLRFRRFLRLKEVGILQAYQKRIYDLDREVQSPIKAITFLETWFTFAIVAIGIPIAFVALAVELYAQRNN